MKKTNPMNPAHRPKAPPRKHSKDMPFENNEPDIDPEDAEVHEQFGDPDDMIGRLMEAGYVFNGKTWVESGKKSGSLSGMSPETQKPRKKGALEH